MRPTDPAERRAVRRYVRLTVVVALAAFVFGGVLVDQMLARDFRPDEIGMAFFLAFAVATVVEVVSGDWGDRYGLRRMTVLGLLMWGAGLITFVLVSSLAGLVMSLVCWSLGQSLYSGAPVSLTVNSISADRADLRQAVVRWGQVARWCGAAAGGAVVLIGARPVGLPVLILAAGLVLVLAAAHVRLRWPESPTAATRRPSRLWLRIRDAWSPGLTPLLLACVSSTAVLSMFLFAWQPTATSVLGLPTQWLGGALVGLTALAAVGSWAVRFGPRSLRRGHRDLWLLSWLAAVLLSVMALAPASAVLAFVGVELATAYVVAAALGRAHSIFPDAARNLLSSMFGAAMGIAMAVTDLAFGLVWERTGLAAALGWCGAAVVGLCLVAWAVTGVRLGSTGRVDGRRPAEPSG